jgi:hypothetical protein
LIQKSWASAKKDLFMGKCALMDDMTSHKSMKTAIIFIDNLVNIKVEGRKTNNPGSGQLAEQLKVQVW